MKFRLATLTAALLLAGGAAFGQTSASTDVDADATGTAGATTDAGATGYTGSSYGGTTDAGTSTATSGGFGIGTDTNGDTTGASGITNEILSGTGVTNDAGQSGSTGVLAPSGCDSGLGGTSTDCGGIGASGGRADDSPVTDPFVGTDTSGTHGNTGGSSSDSSETQTVVP